MATMPSPEDTAKQILDILVVDWPLDPGLAVVPAAAETAVRGASSLLQIRFSGSLKFRDSALCRLRSGAVTFNSPAEMDLSDNATILKWLGIRITGSPVIGT